MAEIDNETEEEEALLLLLLLMWGDLWSQYSAGILTPMLSLAIRDQVQTRIGNLSARAQAGVIAQFGLVVDPSRVARRAADRAVVTVDEIVGRMVDRMDGDSGRRKPEVVTTPTLTGGRLVEVRRPDVEPTRYGEREARVEAVTTVTHVWAMSEIVVANEDARGTIVGIWNAEVDACPICEDLHRKHRPTWERQFPKGPPAHPNCRCRIIWVRLV